MQPPAPGPPPARRPPWLWIVLGAVVVLLVACGAAAAFVVPVVRAKLAASRSTVTTRHPAGGAASPGGSASGTGPGCSYLPAPEGAPEGHRPPMPPAHLAPAGKVRVRLTTSQGELTLELDADAAPCTVNSFGSLTRNGYYDNTPCHRLTTTGIFVLQCGDPSGSGTGGPGYRYGDENLPTGQHPAYPRGTVAMANAGPSTNGSQFFLVYKDSEIDPNYTVFGTITSGLDVLDKIADGGTDDNNGPGDGRPKLDVTIRSAKIT